MALKEAYEKVGKHKLLIWILIVFAVVLVLIALLLSYLVFTYPVNQVSQYGITNATEKANLINQYRTTSIQFIATLAQILGGIAVGIGIYFAWGNLTTAREGQITERFTRAVDQLGAINQSGNPATEIRLGGIYSLERIANKSEKDYWPIMEILTAYVRKNSSVETSETQDQVSFDIQAILTVIGRCTEFRKRWVYMNLTRTNLKKAILRNSNLECILFGEANLEGAKLSGAYLKGSDFRKANLKGAVLKDAHLEDTSFREANLEGANLEMAYLDDTSFWKANLHKARLIHVNLEGVNFYNANLEGAKLGKIFDTIHATNLKKAYLGKANLIGADLKQVNLQEARLQEANLKGTDLRLANLEKANLKGANLEDADLGGEYYDMFFPENSFKGASLVNADLEGVNLKGANLEETNFKGAKNLTVDQLSKAKTLYNAKLDEELEKPLRENYPYLFDEPPKSHHIIF
ncbi:pentapeptide repeat-containing protein [Methanosarcina sp. UBA5]|uniref:pentapeptide repeat-containing protein n=1 Tax=Methanosarcina sp. UBA5 TaxID=1915593 RepID=UPI0025CE2333|nr:pentapeptide repeat-containing protein [Methanosarcina sp. UBA5]